MVDKPYTTNGDDVVIVDPGEPAPPVLVSMPDGSLLTQDEVRAWLDNISEGTSE